MWPTTRRPMKGCLIFVLLLLDFVCANPPYQYLYHRRKGFRKPDHLMEPHVYTLPRPINSEYTLQQKRPIAANQMSNIDYDLKLRQLMEELVLRSQQENPQEVAAGLLPPELKKQYSKLQVNSLRNGSSNQSDLKSSVAHHSAKPDSKRDTDVSSYVAKTKENLTKYLSTNPSSAQHKENTLKFAQQLEFLQKNAEKFKQFQQIQGRTKNAPRNEWDVLSDVDRIQEFVLEMKLQELLEKIQLDTVPKSESSAEDNKAELLEEMNSEEIRDSLETKKYMQLYKKDSNNWNQEQIYVNQQSSSFGLDEENSLDFSTESSAEDITEPLLKKNGSEQLVNGNQINKEIKSKPNRLFDMLQSSEMDATTEVVTEFYTEIPEGSMEENRTEKNTTEKSSILLSKESNQSQMSEQEIESEGKDEKVGEKEMKEKETETKEEENYMEEKEKENYEKETEVKENGVEEKETEEKDVEQKEEEKQRNENGKEEKEKEDSEKKLKEKGTEKNEDENDSEEKEKENYEKVKEEKENEVKENEVKETEVKENGVEENETEEQYVEQKEEEKQRNENGKEEKEKKDREKELEEKETEKKEEDNDAEEKEKENYEKVNEGIENEVKENGDVDKETEEKNVGQKQKEEKEKQRNENGKKEKENQRNEKEKDEKEQEEEEASNIAVTQTNLIDFVTESMLDFNIKKSDYLSAEELHDSGENVKDDSLFKNDSSQSIHADLPLIQQIEESQKNPWNQDTALSLDEEFSQNSEADASVDQRNEESQEQLSYEDSASRLENEFNQTTIMPKVADSQEKPWDQDTAISSYYMNNESIQSTGPDVSITKKVQESSTNSWNQDALSSLENESTQTSEAGATLMQKLEASQENSWDKEDSPLHLANESIQITSSRVTISPNIAESQEKTWNEDTEPYSYLENESSQSTASEVSMMENSWDQESHQDAASKLTTITNIMETSWAKSTEPSIEISTELPEETNMKQTPAQNITENTENLLDNNVKKVIDQMDNETELKFSKKKEASQEEPQAKPSSVSKVIQESSIVTNKELLTKAIITNSENVKDEDFKDSLEAINKESWNFSKADIAEITKVSNGEDTSIDSVEEASIRIPEGKETAERSNVNDLENLFKANTISSELSELNNEEEEEETILESEVTTVSDTEGNPSEEESFMLPEGKETTEQSNMKDSETLFKPFTISTQLPEVKKNEDEEEEPRSEEPTVKIIASEANPNEEELIKLPEDLKTEDQSNLNDSENLFKATTMSADLNTGLPEVWNEKKNEFSSEELAEKIKASVTAKVPISEGNPTDSVKEESIKLPEAHDTEELSSFKNSENLFGATTMSADLNTELREDSNGEKHAISFEESPEKIIATVIPKLTNTKIKPSEPTEEESIKIPEDQETEMQTNIKNSEYVFKASTIAPELKTELPEVWNEKNENPVLEESTKKYIAPVISKISNREEISTDSAEEELTMLSEGSSKDSEIVFEASTISTELNTEIPEHWKEEKAKQSLEESTDENMTSVMTEVTNLEENPSEMEEELSMYPEDQETEDLNNFKDSENVFEATGIPSTELNTELQEVWNEEDDNEGVKLEEFNEEQKLYVSVVNQLNSIMDSAETQGINSLEQTQVEAQATSTKIIAEALVEELAREDSNVESGVPIDEEEKRQSTSLQNQDMNSRHSQSSLLDHKTEDSEMLSNNSFEIEDQTSSNMTSEVLTEKTIGEDTNIGSGISVDVDGKFQSTSLENQDENSKENQASLFDYKPEESEILLHNSSNIASEALTEEIKIGKDLERENFGEKEGPSNSEDIPVINESIPSSMSQQGIVIPSPKDDKYSTEHLTSSKDMESISLSQVTNHNQNAATNLSEIQTSFTTADQNIQESVNLQHNEMKTNSTLSNKFIFDSTENANSVKNVKADAIVSTTMLFVEEGTPRVREIPFDDDYNDEDQDPDDEYQSKNPDDAESGNADANYNKNSNESLVFKTLNALANQEVILPDRFTEQEANDKLRQAEDEVKSNNQANEVPNDFGNDKSTSSSSSITKTGETAELSELFKDFKKSENAILYRHLKENNYAKDYTEEESPSDISSGELIVNQEFVLPLGPSQKEANNKWRQAEDKIKTNNEADEVRNDFGNDNSTSSQATITKPGEKVELSELSKDFKKSENAILYHNMNANNFAKDYTEEESQSDFSTGELIVDQKDMNKNKEILEEGSRIENSHQLLSSKIPAGNSYHNLDSNMFANDFAIEDFSGYLDQEDTSIQDTKKKGIPTEQSSEELENISSTEKSENQEEIPNQNFKYFSNGNSAEDFSSEALTVKQEDELEDYADKGILKFSVNEAEENSLDESAALKSASIEPKYNAISLKETKASEANGLAEHNTADFSTEAVTINKQIPDHPENLNLAEVTEKIPSIESDTMQWASKTNISTEAVSILEQGSAEGGSTDDFSAEALVANQDDKIDDYQDNNILEDRTEELSSIESENTKSNSVESEYILSFMKEMSAAETKISTEAANNLKDLAEEDLAEGDLSNVAVLNKEKEVYSDMGTIQSESTKSSSEPNGLAEENAADLSTDTVRINERVTDYPDKIILSKVTEEKQLIEPETMKSHTKSNTSTEAENISEEESLEALGIKNQEEKDYSDKYISAEENSSIETETIKSPSLESEYMASREEMQAPVIKDFAEEKSNENLSNLSMLMNLEEEESILAAENKENISTKSETVKSSKTGSEYDVQSNKELKASETNTSNKSSESSEAFVRNPEIKSNSSANVLEAENVREATGQKSDHIKLEMDNINKNVFKNHKAEISNDKHWSIPEQQPTYAAENLRPLQSKNHLNLLRTSPKTNKPSVIIDNKPYQITLDDPIPQQVKENKQKLVQPLEMSEDFENLITAIGNSIALATSSSYEQLLKPIILSSIADNRQIDEEIKNIANNLNIKETNKGGSSQNESTLNQHRTKNNDSSMKANDAIENAEAEADNDQKVNNNKIQKKNPNVTFVNGQIDNGLEIKEILKNNENKGNRRTKDNEMSTIENKLFGIIQHEEQQQQQQTTAIDNKLKMVKDNDLANKGNENYAAAEAEATFQDYEYGNEFENLSKIFPDTLQEQEQTDLTSNPSYSHTSSAELAAKEITTTNWWYSLPYEEIRKFLNSIFDGATF